MARQVYLNEEKQAELMNTMLGFVKRVALAEGAKTPEEVAILPGMIKTLTELFA